MCIGEVQRDTAGPALALSHIRRSSVGYDRLQISIRRSVYRPGWCAGYEFVVDLSVPHDTTPSPPTRRALEVLMYLDLSRTYTEGSCIPPGSRIASTQQIRCSFARMRMESEQIRAVLDPPRLTTISSARIRCRELTGDDRAEVLALLGEGFPDRSPNHLRRSWDRLSSHATPTGLPKFGYGIEADGRLVGVILLLSATVVDNGATRVRSNVSSWYVRREFRSYGSLLVSRVLAKKEVTYLNVTPAPHTWRTLEAQGYKRLSTGLFAAVPAMSSHGSHVRVELFSSAASASRGLSEFETALLRDHAGYGCMSVACIEGGSRYPFVFTKRRWIRWKAVMLPFTVLAYCRSVDEFVRFAGSLGRFLLRRGIGIVFVDARAPISGLAGRYLDWGPKFYRGPNPPRLGDIAYTERVMFDF